MLDNIYLQFVCPAQRPPSKVVLLLKRVIALEQCHKRRNIHIHIIVNMAEPPGVVGEAWGSGHKTLISARTCTLLHSPVLCSTVRTPRQTCSTNTACSTVHCQDTVCSNGGWHDSMLSDSYSLTPMLWRAQWQLASLPGCGVLSDS